MRYRCRRCGTRRLFKDHIAAPSIRKVDRAAQIGPLGHGKNACLLIVAGNFDGNRFRQFAGVVATRARKTAAVAQQKSYALA
jgi:hypothetical protein